MFIKWRLFKRLACVSLCMILHSIKHHCQSTNTSIKPHKRFKTRAAACLSIRKGGRRGHAGSPLLLWLLEVTRGITSLAEVTHSQNRLSLLLLPTDTQQPSGPIHLQNGADSIPGIVSMSFRKACLVPLF